MIGTGYTITTTNITIEPDKFAMLVCCVVH